MHDSSGTAGPGGLWNLEVLGVPGVLASRDRVLLFHHADVVQLKIRHRYESRRIFIETLYYPVI